MSQSEDECFILLLLLPLSLPPSLPPPISLSLSLCARAHCSGKLTGTGFSGQIHLSFLLEFFWYNGTTPGKSQVVLTIQHNHRQWSKLFIWLLLFMDVSVTKATLNKASLSGVATLQMTVKS